MTIEELKKENKCLKALLKLKEKEIKDLRAFIKTQNDELFEYKKEAIENGKRWKSIFKTRK